MTSSLRNSLHRRNHKERSQLSNRSRFGFLEKHKDYVLRARDYHSKQDRLTRLRQKASERNKDEFYFGMNKERTRGGVHIKDRGNVALPVDIVKVLKTQDENYIRTMRTAGLKKIDKIKAQLTALADLVKPLSVNSDNADDSAVEDDLDDNEFHILQEAGVISRSRSKGNGETPKHIVFVDNEEEALKFASRRKPSTSNTHVNMDIAESTHDLGWKVPDSKKTKRKSNVALETTAGDDREAAEERRQMAAKNRSRLLKELSARLIRDTQLRYVEREFEMQRALMGKGGRRKLRGVEKVEGGDEDVSEDEDTKDDRRLSKGKGKGSGNVVDEKIWKPRVYKWKLERKR